MIAVRKTGFRRITVVVQLPDRRGSILTIRFPQQIADAIRRAVAAGWRAEEPGSGFVVDSVSKA